MLVYLSNIFRNFEEESVRRMELGGNKRLLDFVKRAGLSVSPLATVNDKYTHPWLGLYRKYIAALGNGTEPPSLSREALDEVCTRQLHPQAILITT